MAAVAGYRIVASNVLDDEFGDLSQKGPTCSGIVLAGGKSRRMGRDKAWIELGGQPLIVRVVERLRRVCDEIVVVANDFGPLQNLDVVLVRDAFPGSGSLGGIYTGLEKATSPFAIAVACDMPFLNIALLRYMLAQSPGFDLVIPSVPDEHRGALPTASATGARPTAKDAHLHPLHAIYAKTCLAPMEQAIRRGDLRLISFHAGLRIRHISAAEVERFDPQHLSLFNVNTPQDLEYARQLVTQD